MQNAMFNNYNIMNAECLAFVCVYVITLEAKTTTQFSYLSTCTVTLNHLNSLSLMWDLLQMSAKPHTHTQTKLLHLYGMCTSVFRGLSQTK